MPYTPYYAYHMVKKHLYNSQNWTDNQVKAFNAMYGFNILGIYPWKGTIDSIYDTRNGDRYRDRYGISGGGYDPRRAPDANVGASVSSALNYMSRNVDKLYDDYKKSKKSKRLSYDEMYQIWLQEKW